MRFRLSPEDIVRCFSSMTLKGLLTTRSPAVSPTGPTPVVEQVRQTGAAYVRAVSDLQGASSIATRDQGHQAALDSLLEAAEELSRLQPNDPVLKLVLRVLKKGAGTEP